MKNTANRKILLLFPRIERGESYKRLLAVTESLLQEGYTVHYVSTMTFPITNDSQLVAKLLRLPVKKNSGFLFWFFFLLYAPFFLCRVCSRESYSIIATFKPGHGLLAKLSSLIFNVPLYLYVNYLPSFLNKPPGLLGIRYRLTSLIDLLAFYVADNIIVSTNLLASKISSKYAYFHNRLTVISPQIKFPGSNKSLVFGRPDESFWNKFLSDAPTRKRKIMQRFSMPEKWLLFVSYGELKNRKEIENLLRAMSGLTSEKICLLIYGDGPEKTSLLSIVVGLGLSDRVFFLGWSENFFDLISAADLFVLPDHDSGISDVLLQAMGAGVPIIAPDVPDVREILLYDTLLFKPQHVDALYKRIEFIVSGRGQLEQLKKLTRERALAYSSSVSEGGVL